MEENSLTCAVCGENVKTPHLNVEIKNYNKDGSSMNEVTCSENCTEEYKNTRGI